MTYGTLEDLSIVLEEIQLEDLQEALDGAPAGIFDKRSWAYWNVRCGRAPPLLPARQLEMGKG